jgi:hypothetical protein
MIRTYLKSFENPHKQVLHLKKKILWCSSQQ